MEKEHHEGDGMFSPLKSPNLFLVVSKRDQRTRIDQKLKAKQELRKRRKEIDFHPSNGFVSLLSFCVLSLITFSFCEGELLCALPLILLPFPPFHHDIAIHCMYKTRLFFTLQKDYEQDKGNVYLTRFIHGYGHGLSSSRCIAR